MIFDEDLLIKENLINEDRLMKEDLINLINEDLLIKEDLINLINEDLRIKEDLIHLINEDLIINEDSFNSTHSFHPLHVNVQDADLTLKFQFKFCLKNLSFEKATEPSVK